MTPEEIQQAIDKTNQTLKDLEAELHQVRQKENHARCQLDAIEKEKEGIKCQIELANQTYMKLHFQRAGIQPLDPEEP